MSSKSVIKIDIKTILEGKEMISEASVDLKELQRIVGDVANATKNSTLNLAAFCAVLNDVSGMVSQLSGFINEMSAAYATQVEAETKLETVMRQRMNATNAEIQSIKDLAAAQQQLGVIGDEVQLAGAQQVATFLKEKTSIETLLPAMNNLLAQQKGLNATSGDAVAVANLMGKAMQGQTSALRRVGITFTSAQEQVMKYGDESERAAMLAQIITDNVGDMNAQLAATDAGKQKQVANALGDVKERIGAAVKGLQPYVALMAQATTAATGLIKAAKAIQSVTTAIRAMSAATKAFMAIGVVAAISAIVWVVNELTSASSDATEEIEAVKAATDTFTATVANAQAEFDREIAKLKNLIDAHADTAQAVNELNAKYGESFGYHSTAADWYDVLTNKSRIYCKQLGYEAQAKALSAKLAEAELKKEEAWKQIQSSRGDNAFVMVKQGGGYAPVDLTRGALDKMGRTTDASAGSWIHNESLANAVQDYINANSDIKDINASLDTTATLMKGVQTEMGNVNKPAIGSYAELEKAATDASAAAKRAQDELKQMGDNTPADDKSKKIAEVQRLAEAEVAAKKKVSDAAKRYGLPDPYPTTTKTNPSSRSNAKKKDTEAIVAPDFGAPDVLTAPDYEPIPGKYIESYADLSTVLQRLQTDFANAADAEKRAKIGEQIDALRGMEQSWRDIDNAAKPLPEAAHLKTLREVDEAIQQASERMATASADEQRGLRETIHLYEQKKSEISRGAEIADRQREIDRMSRLRDLSPKSYRTTIMAVGVDGYTEQIQRLKDQLAGIDGPLTDADTSAIDAQIAALERMRREAVDAFGALRDGWSGVKGIGSGIQSLTSAIEGNGDAWSKTVAIVDSFLQIYDGISAVVGIISQLVAVSASHAAQKAAEGIAVGGEAAAESAAAAAKATEAPITIALNKAETASWAELASARFYAAHAYIPFAGAGIATGFIAAMIAQLQAIGVMPFADGGVIYGPTLGLIGEYAGAGHNPEVVAPLDRLRDLIQPASLGGKVEFEIKGRKLVGVIAKESNLKYRS